MSESRVLYRGIGWEITLREVISSIFILGVMFFIGFLISSEIEKRINNRTLKYRQAISISTDSEFKHGLRTSIGNAFVRGTLDTTNPVSYVNVKGKHLSISVKKQRYTRHTRHYTTRDSKGHVHHHTSHYWSWDTIGHEYFHAKQVRFCDVNFPFGEFDYGEIPESRKLHKSNPFSHYREIIHTIPTNFNATVFGCLKNSRFIDKTPLTGKPIEKFRECLCHSIGLHIFWTVWTILTIGFVIMFYFFENNWLEDGKLPRY